MNKWRRFRRLSWPEQESFFLALVLLPITALALRLMGLRRAQAVMARLTPAPVRSPEGHESIRHQQAFATARLVKAAANHGLYRGNCLKQSLALWWLLRLRRMECDLRIGVSKTAAGMEAHAWVECGGRPLNDHEDVALRFLPFESAITPG